jgi:hypothetical protein
MPSGRKSFFGVIHFVSDPAFKDSKTNFQIDFGSAPVGAFMELLETLRISGATLVYIGSL